MKILHIYTMMIISSIVKNNLFSSLAFVRLTKHRRTYKNDKISDISIEKNEFVKITLRTL
jgi:hypothetical protein